MLSLKLAVAFKFMGFPHTFQLYAFLFVGSAYVGGIPDSAAFFRHRHKVVLDPRMGISAARDEGEEADANWEDDV